MNGGQEVGRIYYAADIDTKTLASSASKAEGIVQSSADRTSSAVDKSNKKMQASYGATAKSIVAVAGVLLALRTAGNFLQESVDVANKYASAFAGLDSVARAYGRDQDEARQAAQALAADGLIPITQAVTAFKNALSSGYSIDEATRLLSGLKDQAAFNRQSFYDLGGAVVATTEGIRNGNSVLSDATGTTKNLSVIAKEAGISVNEMGSIQSNTAYRTAVLNGFLEQTNLSLGDASKYAQTAAGQDAKLAQSFQQLEVKVGNAANAIRFNFIKGLQEFVVDNQTAIISIGSGAVSMAAFAGSVYGLIKALGGLSKALSLVARHPVIAILTLTIGLLASFVASNVLDELSAGFGGVTEGADGAGKALGGAGDAADETAKKMKKLDEELKKIDRDYIENLASIVQRHQQLIKDLTAQVADENDNYNRAFRDRLNQFTSEQTAEQQAHQKKVTNLTNQIDFLRKYNNASNRQQLAELQFSLAQENAQYDEALAEREAKYSEDVAAEQASHDTRIADLQVRLNAENEILNKHAEDVAAVRDVILLDEIEQLKRSKDEQIQSAKDAVKGVNDAYGTLGTTLPSSFDDIGKDAGKAMGDAFGQAIKDAFVKTFTDLIKGINDFMNDLGSGIRQASRDFYKSDFGRAFTLSGGSISGALGRLVTGQYASGGFTGRGGKYDPAGTVHKGEFVVPQDFVDQSSGLPNADFLEALGGGIPTGGGVTQITFAPNMSGIMTSSKADERLIAQRIFDRFNEIAKAKGVAQVGVNQ